MLNLGLEIGPKIGKAFKVIAEVRAEGKPYSFVKELMFEII